MRCQMPLADNSGQTCGAYFSSRASIGTKGIQDSGLGDYVRHLIKAHWPLLVKVREAFERGEIKL